MLIRFDRAVEAGLCSPIRSLGSSALRHGEYDYYVRYVHRLMSRETFEGHFPNKLTRISSLARSGTYLQTEKMKGDKELLTLAQQWKAKLDRGETVNPTYFQKKWGCPAENFKQDWRKTCTGSKPFGKAELPISWWKLDPRRRECIDGHREMVDRDCPFTQSLI